MNIKEILKKESISASAPCRIDMGGTLDLSTFFLPLRHLQPCTFNAALDMRTSVEISSYQSGKVKVSSRGFDSLVADSANASFDNPLGLMFAVASYFNVDGVHIEIDSSSPPRSALGGSSAAAAALIWAFCKALAKDGRHMPTRSVVAMLAHWIEQSVAGVPCGMQDQLAAIYGGVNAWHWIAEPQKIPFRQQAITPEICEGFEKRLLIAYCGAPHVSKDINGTWVRQFVGGYHRQKWRQIVECSRQFVSALAIGDYQKAQDMMNRETEIRTVLTPDVLDVIGKQLVESAIRHGCGARFTGAGGGGCIWALGAPEALAALGSQWESILKDRQEAKILNTGVDYTGLL